MAFKKHVVHRSYCGVPLSVHIEDREAAGWYSDGWELEEVDLLSTGKLKGGALVFEIGSHQGVVAIVLGKFAQRVIAVEANARCVDLARRNISLNRIENVEVIHAAGAAKSGTLTFSGSDHVSREEGGEGRYSVPAVAIDELSRRFGTPDVLYIDVEGYEVEVLRGASETLSSNPDIFIEVHAGQGLETFGGSVKEVVDGLYGYELYVSAPYKPFVAVPRGCSLVEWADATHLLADRFFLVAMSGARTKQD